jgi:hypothetical protein
MNKRYQVFISSTYADLKEERAKVIQTIMELDCIPAGMEIFPAIDEEQFEFIKKVIDDCDYYLLIIGGRYGSLSEEGISYTEMEYDYAISKGIKIIAFVHSNPDQIPIGKSEKDSELREKLENFREKVSTNRLIKFWSNANELPGLVALSLSKTIKTYPAIGWVRSNSIGDSSILLELNDLRKENISLKEDIQNYSSQNDKSKLVDSETLAGFEDKFLIKGKGSNGDWEINLTWEEIFYTVSPYLMQVPADNKINGYLAQIFAKKIGKLGFSNFIDTDTFQTLKVHLSSLGLVDIKLSKTTQGGTALFWSLTEKGKAEMLRIRSVKK